MQNCLVRARRTPLTSNKPAAAKPIVMSSRKCFPVKARVHEVACEAQAQGGLKLICSRGSEVERNQTALFLVC